MLFAARAKDVATVKKTMSELSRVLPQTPQHLRVAKYNYAHALFELEMMEECVTATLDLIVEYYDLLGLTLGDIMGKNPHKIFLLLKDGNRHTDDLKHLADSLDLQAKAIKATGNHPGLAHIQWLNRLSTYDSNRVNIGDTTLSMRDVLLEPLQDSACKQALIFVDACAEDFPSVVQSRDVIGNLDVSEVREFLDSGWYLGAFLSCSPGEKSYPSRKLGHGIWTHFLLEALHGRAKDALTRDRWLTGEGLQNYLRQEVPRYITREMSIPGSQTPQAILSSSNSFRIHYVPRCLPYRPTPRLLASGFAMMASFSRERKRARSGASRASSADITRCRTGFPTRRADGAIAFWPTPWRKSCRRSISTRAKCSA